MPQIIGYCPNNRQTAKAVRVTVISVDGEALMADTCWLPRSIATDLDIRSTDEGVEVRATVPAWWVRKLDARPSWQRQGLAQAPMAQRPW